MGLRRPHVCRGNSRDLPDRSVEAFAVRRVKSCRGHHGPHGFLSYLINTNIEERVYKIFGYKGKQVRDNIHAKDVAGFIRAFVAAPRCGEVYNLGGGRGNSCSILEAFEAVEGITGKPMHYEYVDAPRAGDHICYISDLRKMRTHYLGWDVRIPLSQILEEIVAAWRARLQNS